MTNEEKTRELVGCPCPTKIRDCEACFDRIKVLEMAEWKDQQMIDIFERFVNRKFHKGDAEMLIRDFKKAMEE